MNKSSLCVCFFFHVCGTFQARGIYSLPFHQHEAPKLNYRLESDGLSLPLLLLLSLATYLAAMGSLLPMGKLGLDVSHISSYLLLHEQAALMQVGSHPVRSQPVSKLY